jgi:hypothetical protein
LRLPEITVDIDFFFGGNKKMRQYFPAFKLPDGNAAFGERRLPVQHVKRNVTRKNKTLRNNN